MLNMAVMLLRDLPLSLVFLALLSIALLAYRLIIYPALISPLAKIPNAHWSAPFSPLWILYQRFKKRENAVLLKAHKRLGPFIRVGPSDVNVDDLDAVKTIYIGGFEKPGWYGVFDNYGYVFGFWFAHSTDSLTPIPAGRRVPCMFSSRQSRDHSLRKRMISHVYSKSYIQSSLAAEAQAKTILYDRMMPVIEASRADQGIDVYSLFLAGTMDLISAYIWGLCRSTNFVQHKGYREHWLELYKSRNDHPYFPQELPRLTAFCKRIGIHLYPSWVDAANQELAAWNTAVCDRTLADLAAGKDATDTADDAVVMKALLSGLDKEALRGKQSPLYDTAILQRDLSIRSELWDHVLAGQETAGLALTYLSWQLCQHPELQKQLRDELLGLQPNMRLSGHGGQGGVMPDAKQLDSLPLLHAIVMETLRVHAPIPGPQPRQAPYPSAQIGQYTVAGGTRVAAMAHSLHQDEGVFARADQWDPKRWLDADADSRKDMRRQWWAFSSGGRMCIGSNFAMHEIKLIAAAVYSNYTTHIVDDTGIEQGDGYTGRPASEQLWLRFASADNTAVDVDVGLM